MIQEGQYFPKFKWQLSIHRQLKGQLYWFAFQYQFCLFNNSRVSMSQLMGTISSASTYFKATALKATLFQLQFFAFRFFSTDCLDLYFNFEFFSQFVEGPFLGCLGKAGQKFPIASMPFRYCETQQGAFCQQLSQQFYYFPVTCCFACGNGGFFQIYIAAAQESQGLSLKKERIAAVFAMNLRACYISCQQLQLLYYIICETFQLMDI
ncbi:hypothetical protein FGO68_gene15652 [Halteria grandinella]|uniref:Uncharacterized protein n=1 Tax=Halteria grandinella TaxID=5974 RepID=A0A8J8SW47_HALGN|nr:hypothetical protein FGO68_gene15652 [Halteria grandinella]